MSYLAPSTVNGRQYLAPASEPAQQQDVVVNVVAFMAPATIDGREYFAPSMAVQAQQPSGGGAGSPREVRRFADLLDKARKPSRKQRKERRQQLEAEALELLPDLLDAEQLAPVVARMVYEQEARFMASLPNNRTPNEAEPVETFNSNAALQDFVQKLLAQAQIQAENDAEEEFIDMLLLGA